MSHEDLKRKARERGVEVRDGMSREELIEILIIEEEIFKSPFGGF